MVTLGRWDAEIVDCCPICGREGKFVMIAPVKWDDIYSCPNCNTSYNSPRMTREVMEDFYRSGVYSRNERNLRNQVYCRGRTNFGERRRALMRKCR